MGETMQPMPEEVSEEKFQEAEEKLEASGVTPESPTHNQELMRQWEEDKKRRDKGYPDTPGTWQTKEQNQ